jgi:hypothetical protein
MHLPSIRKERDRSFTEAAVITTDNLMVFSVPPKQMPGLYNEIGKDPFRLN